MPRRLRLEFPGALYHVTNRGDRGGAVFADDTDRRGFLTTLEEAVLKAGWQVHAFCLLPGHFHLVLETPQPTLVVGMKWLLGTFTGRTNRRHRVRGHLFAGRYRALPIDPGGGYFRIACEHVLLNPARARLLGDGEPLESYPWSSLPTSLRPPEERPGWLNVRRVLDASNIPEDSATGRDRWLAMLEARRSAMEPCDWQGLRRGWCFGGPEFRASLLNELAAATTMVGHGVVPRPAQEILGRQIITEELAACGLTTAMLARRARTDPVKVAIARRVRRETSLSLRWLAGELRAGSVHTLRNALAAAPASPAARSSEPSLPTARAHSPQPEVRPSSHGAAPGPAGPAGAAPPDAGLFSVTWD